MGEAKRKRENTNLVVYHHTSVLRIEQICESGIIQLEGNNQCMNHPLLGPIQTSLSARRKAKDFPPLVWFTKRISIPRCICSGEVWYTDKQTSLKKQVSIPEDQWNIIAQNRIALGFSISSIDAIPWPKHAGFETSEGNELNECAKAVGDNPNDWYVTDNAVNVLLISEYWYSPSISNPRLQLFPNALATIHEKVAKYGT